MTQRIRNLNNALNGFFNGNQIRALYQAFGINMGAYKKAAQTVSASTTLVNDDTMWSEFYGAGQHNVSIYLPTTMTAAGGMKLQFVADQGLTINNISMNVSFNLTGVASASGVITSLGSTVNGGTTNAWTSVLIVGSVDVVNGGVLQLQWAQQAASGSTAVNTGATLYVDQVTGDATF